MKRDLRKAWPTGLAAAVLIALLPAIGTAGPPATPQPSYTRDENMPSLGSRIGVGVKPRIGVNVVPRTGIGADTGIGKLDVTGETPGGVLSPSGADSPATIREAQKALNAQGLAPDTDGFIGPRTRQAIRTYQRNHGLPVTGALDNATRQSLGLP